MPRMIICRKYKREMEGLDAPPMPGNVGQDLFENISKKAWKEWVEHQTMIINEKHLNMMDMGSRTYLREQMEKFFSGEKYDQADGYTPNE